MAGFLIGLWHLFEVNLIGNAIAHGSLTLKIINGFLYCLHKFYLAHKASFYISYLASILSYLGIFFYSSNKEFDGIINHLSKTNDAFIFNLINVTALSYYSDDLRYHPFNVIMYNCSDRIFMSKDEPYSWISFDFNQYRVRPSKYMIKPIENKDKPLFPLSWIIEGSSNNVDWTIIDVKVQWNGFNSIDFKPNIFTIGDNKKNEHFRYIRMRLIDTNVNNNYIFALDSIEFYGSLAKLKNNGDGESIETPKIFEYKE